MKQVSAGFVCIFLFSEQKRWCRPVKPSQAKPHCGVAFNGSNLSILIFQKEKAHQTVCFSFCCSCTLLILVVGTGTGQICLQFSFPWKENLWSRSVEPSRAALIRTAFSFSNLSAHNKNPNPYGFGFSLLLVHTLDITIQLIKSFQIPVFFIRWGIFSRILCFFINSTSR